VQSLACLIATVIGIGNKDAVQEHLDFWLGKYDKQFMKNTLDDMKGGEHTVLMVYRRPVPITLSKE
jgi:hypothetical protein